MNRRPTTSLQYVGLDGITASCLDAIKRYFHFGDVIESALILSCGNHHGLALKIDGDYIMVRSGFTSGYSGEGPSGFSAALRLLRSTTEEIEEVEINEKLHHRLNAGAMTAADVTWLKNAPRTRPIAFDEFIRERDWPVEGLARIWRSFPHTIPPGITEERLVPLAHLFQTAPEQALFDGYRMLEDTVRTRSKLNEHGSKLFSRAFLGADSFFHWIDTDPTEQIGRGNLFVAVYQAFRNPRAHRLSSSHSSSMVREFLLLNELFFLEASAVSRVFKGPQGPTV